VDSKAECDQTNASNASSKWTVSFCCHTAV